MTGLTHTLRKFFQGRLAVPYVFHPLLFVALLGLLTSPVLAGGGKGHHRHTPAEKLDKLTKKLSLNDEQRAAILPILEDKHQQMEALHNQMKEVRQNAMAQVEAQLSPEQQEKFKKAREKRKQQMEKYKKGHEKKGKHGKKHKKHGHVDDHDEHDDDHDEHEEMKH